MSVLKRNPALSLNYLRLEGDMAGAGVFTYDELNFKFTDIPSPPPPPDFDIEKWCCMNCCILKLSDITWHCR